MTKSEVQGMCKQFRTNVRLLFPEGDISGHTTKFALDAREKRTRYRIMRVPHLPWVELGWDGKRNDIANPRGEINVKTEFAYAEVGWWQVDGVSRQAARHVDLPEFPSGFRAETRRYPIFHVPESGTAPSTDKA